MALLCRLPWLQTCRWGTAQTGRLTGCCMTTGTESYVDWTWVTSGTWMDQAHSVSPKPGMVLLSTPLSKTLLERMWHRTWPHLVADGGATVLQATAPELLPELVLGDLDSARPEVLQSYRDRGVEVRDLSHDQDTTDLEKCLNTAQKDFACKRIFVAGTFAGVQGCFDHTLGALNALCKAEVQGINAALLSDDSCCILLPKGRHCLTAPRQSCCGLVPLGGPVRVTTSGLCWDMKDAVLEWGGLVSTSNGLDEAGDGLVWVDTDGTVLWTCNNVP
ncbi:unnamed protein product [Durusdinium trenchii]|uniref:Thiamin pyrophosphokinase thiamin-binding domain-containing protein n=1 Tax=Durusdinium trenchii TaxID=1381693 RepID=A0ABP0PUM9_9DINO